MTWIRYGKIRAIWKCATSRGYDTRYHAVGVSIKDEYANKPEDEIEIWAGRLGDFVARRMCQNACESLSTSVFCDEGSVQVEIIYTSEMLVARPGAKEEEKVIEEIEKVEPEKIEEKLVEEEKKRPEEKVVEEIRPKVPAYILGQIEYLEDRYDRAETVDEKMAIREEIDILKRRFEIR